MIETPRWTAADDARLRAMVAEGRSSLDVAAALDRSRDAIRIRARRIGVTWAGTSGADRKRAGGLMTGAAKTAERQERMKQARDMWHDGLTRRDIAARMGLSLNAVSKYCAGLVRPEDHKAAMQRFCKPRALRDPKLSKAELLAPRVAECRARGMTVDQMAVELKVSRETVRRAAHLAGVELKRPAAKAKPERAIRRVNWNRVAMPTLPPKPAMPTITAAAQFLGRWYRPVHRADIERPVGTPREYRVGRLVLPTLEMLDLARSKGFAA